MLIKKQFCRINMSNATKLCTTIAEAAQALDSGRIVLQQLVEQKQCLPEKEKRQILAIGKLLTSVANILKTSATKLTPGGGDANWIAKRKRKDAEKEDTASQRRRTDSYKDNMKLHLANISKFQEGLLMKSPNHPIGNPTNLRRRSSTRVKKALKEQAKGVPFPSPSDGNEFTPQEAVEHLSKRKEKGGSLTPMIKHWIKKKYIPIKERKMLYLLTAYKDGNSLAWKGSSGRQDYVPTQPFLDECKATQCALDKKVIRSILCKVKKQQSQVKGENVVGRRFNPSDRTVDRYLALAAERLDLKYRKKVQSKPRNRYAAEHSLRSATSFALTHAVSGFIFDTRHSPPKPIESSSKGAQELVQMISSVQDGSLGSMLPGIITSTDDTTIFAFEGTQSTAEEGQWKLVPKQELQGHRSVYVVDSNGSGNRQFNGHRVRLTQTFASNGRVAPIWATLTGLTELELPSSGCPSGIYILEIPGLCVGGTNVHSQGTGFIACIRQNALDCDNESVEQRLFAEYNKKVYYPFVTKLREIDLGIDPDLPVGDHQRIFGWTDGGIPQLKAISSNKEIIQMDKKLKIHRNKHAASCSAVQQPADVMSFFRSLKQGSRQMSASDTVNYCDSFSKSLRNHFQKSGIINVDQRKLKGPIDFLACLPSLYSKIADPNLVMNGFIRTGMIDRNTKIFPDLEVMLDTCKDPNAPKELVYQHFGTLYKEVFDTGMISEGTFERLGFPKDCYEDGTACSRDATIAQECRQRAKSLSHKVQQELRNKHLNRAVEQKKREANIEWSAEQQICDDNRDAEKTLFKAMGLQLNSRRRALENAKEEHFKKLSVSALRAFIHVRKWTTAKPDKDWKWPNKKVKNDGDMNLVDLAYKLRTTYSLKMLSSSRPRRIDDDTAVNLAPPPPPTIEILTRHSIDDSVLSSKFLQNADWVNTVKKSVKGAFFLEDVDKYLMDQADDLSRLLIQRLKIHIDNKVNQGLENHYSLTWFGKNIPQLAAMLVMSEQVKEEPDLVKSSASLLKPPLPTSQRGKFMQAKGGILKYEGSYLHYDGKNRKWIRSGKVSGRSMGYRLEEHKTEAQKIGGRGSLKKSSQLYSRYPSNNSPMAKNFEDNNVSPGWDGHYEDLQVFAGFCYNRNETDQFKGLEGLLDEKNGIFLWDRTTLERLEKNKKLGSCIENKKLTMIAYLFELGYDLMLATDSNVSMSPGFEQAGLTAVKRKE